MHCQNRRYFPFLIGETNRIVLDEVKTTIAESEKE
jgi:hypothetical protein